MEPTAGLEPAQRLPSTLYESVAVATEPSRLENLCKVRSFISTASFGCVNGTYDSIHALSGNSALGCFYVLTVCKMVVWVGLEPTLFV